MMAAERSFASLGASAVDLDQAATDRLADAQLLFDSERYVSSIAFGLYALEIRLKVTICRRLDLQRLPKPFEIHDLAGLLVLTGLSRNLNKKPARPIKKNWNELLKTSKALNELRYMPNSQRDPQQAADFFDQLRD